MTQVIEVVLFCVSFLILLYNFIYTIDLLNTQDRIEITVPPPLKFLVIMNLLISAAVFLALFAVFIMVIVKNF